jgi:hypothetical protein
VGANAGAAVSAGHTGSSNVIVGANAACRISGTSAFNVFLGTSAAPATGLQGSCNVGVGHCVLSALTVGCNNVAVGFRAGQNATSTCNSVVIGNNVCLPSATGVNQLAIGYGATSYWLTGCNNGDIRPAAGLLDCAVCVGTFGQVLTSTGSALEWKNVDDVTSNPTFGYFLDTSTQTVTTVNTPQPVQLGLLATSNNVFSITPGTFIISDFQGGWYNIQFSIQLQTTSASLSNVEIWLSQSGNAVANTNTRFITKGSGQASFAALNYLVQVTNPSDTWGLVWATDDSNMTLATLTSSFGGPTIPSVILSVVPVGL